MHGSKTSLTHDLSNKENYTLISIHKPVQFSRSKTLEAAIFSEYGESIEKTHRLKELETSTDDCLKLHRINEELRSKMVDWMVEVLHIFECSQRTFFLSVRIMDLFFKKQQSTLGIEELHVVGVACMLIASKYEDIRPLTMQTIFHKIGHERLPRAYIATVEKNILQTIEYKVCIPTVADFLEALVEGQNDRVKRVAGILAEITMLEARLAWLRPSVLAQAVFAIASSIDLQGQGPLNGVVSQIMQLLTNFQAPYQASFVKHNASLSMLGEISFHGARLH